MGADWVWWPARSSKPLGGALGGSGGFDSHTFPPTSKTDFSRGSASRDPEDGPGHFTIRHSLFPILPFDSLFAILGFTL